MLQLNETMNASFVAVDKRRGTNVEVLPLVLH